MWGRQTNEIPKKFNNNLDESLSWRRSKKTRCFKASEKLRSSKHGEDVSSRRAHECIRERYFADLNHYFYGKSSPLIATKRRKWFSRSRRVVIGGYFWFKHLRNEFQNPESWDNSIYLFCSGHEKHLKRRLIHDSRLSQITPEEFLLMRLIFNRQAAGKQKQFFKLRLINSLKLFAERSAFHCLLTIRTDLEMKLKLRSFKFPTLIR